MIYTQLTSEYKYDTIAEAIYAREMEYFHYDFDRVNFQYLLVNTDEEAFKTDLTSRLADTLAQMKKVESIMAALRSQIDDQAAYDNAVIRTTAKRATKEKESK